ncbi:MAG: hypothetical protein ACREGK_01495, partial [Geminicoccales bacterium]
MNALPGIGNENEFYSEHYIGEFLARDIVRDDGQDAASLDHLGRAYLTMREQWERTRDPAARLELQRGFHHELLTALGYTFHPQSWLSADDIGLPALTVVKGADGATACLVLEVLAGEIDADSLACTPQVVQLEENAEPFAEQSWEQWISGAVFGAPEPPRWVILLSAAEALLIDRHKWAASRLLRFDWETLFTRREGGGLKVAAGLLACESLVPGSGQALLDRLDERAHKHAFAVSEDLKYALRESVELIGNEVVRDLRERRRERIYERDLAAPLTRECLTLMYRLLFLFFVEARPTLGYAPMASEVYAKGYSLERLRDVAEQRLTNPQAVGGDYLNRSLKHLFELIWNGFPPESGHGQQRIEAGQQHSFELPPLKCHLFDPARTPLINRARLSNGVLHRVLELMSLTRPGSGRRGRVSYANLGIIQLGAVYEALLAYRGFFAEEDLYEVKPAKERWDPLKQGFFVRREALDQYEEDEKVFDPETGRVRRYEKGSYIYRLAGREREQSASYYTPESLTQCLVKYALKERLDGLSADEILHLTVCEPAMGSAAFLNEAVNQLAEAYLSRKQDETGVAIPHERYAAEVQRVRMRIADTCVFGADLNPVAVELAEVSLWLNAITDGAFVPWFGMQIVTGNSLIGARREVYAVERLTASRKQGRWHEHAPERLDPAGIATATPDRAGRVYHFLLPDPGMSKYADRVVKDLVPERIASFAEWRRGFCKKLEADELATVQRLSDACDALWQAHAELLARVRAKTTDALAVWPAQPDPVARPTTTAWK